MRKSLVLAAIAAVLATPTAFAQVGVNLGGGIGVQAGPINAGMQGRGHLDTGIAPVRSRARANADASTRADVQPLPGVDAGAVSATAQQAGATAATDAQAMAATAPAAADGTARAAARTSGELAADVRQEARAGARATQQASARAATAANANANAAADSALGTVDQVGAGGAATTRAATATLAQGGAGTAFAEGAVPPADVTAEGKLATQAAGQVAVDPAQATTQVEAQARGGAKAGTAHKSPRRQRGADARGR